MSKNKAKRPGKGGVSGSGGKAGSANVKCPPKIEYHLHVDANRDGVVDDDRTGIDLWEWGAGKKGAIILCNNDDDDAATQCDHEDGVINGGNDYGEIAPIDIRRIGPQAPPTWKGWLSVDVDDARRIRLFDSRGPGGNEIIGPVAGESYQFPNLNFTKKKLGMESLYYAGNDFPNGTVKLRFTIQKTDGTVLDEYAELGVAPWIMPNHLDGADTVYVVDSTQNGQFRTDLDKFVKAAGCTLVTHASGDVWMQDCMELGYSNLPTFGFRSTMLAPRPRPLETFPITLRTKDFGYHEQGARLPESTFNSTGNLEVTPPLTSQAGKRYPWGRIYYGPGRAGVEMNPDVVAFLAKQMVQAPVPIDTNWLTVGHVDEMMSFVPAPGGKGFKLLLASPTYAYDLLDQKKLTNPTDIMLTGREFPNSTRTGWVSAEVSIEDFLDNGIPNLPTASNPILLRIFNVTVQATIDDIQRDTLETEFGLDAGDIIKVPIIFMENEHQPGLADSLTAGMVNMLVINKHCIFPKPFGPVVGGKDLFEDDLTRKLKALNLVSRPIDDWYDYHVMLGEVHCGTNTRRKPKIAKWWEFVP